MNFKLTIQYDGTDFHGWQMQGEPRAGHGEARTGQGEARTGQGEARTGQAEPRTGQGELRTVQGELTKALSLIDGRDVIVQGSGRTDAGVHAEGQVASVVLQKEISTEKLRSAINGNVGKDVRVLLAETVPDEFHARYSAKEKTYRYSTINGPVLSPFWLRYAHQDARPLDLERMRSCARVFLGTHDWTAFSSAQTETETKTRTVTGLTLEKRCDRRAHYPIIELTISADGFLRYMVRSIAGTLLAVGRNDMDEELVQRALNDGDRSLVAATAPACGLTLVSVRYE